MPTVQPKTFEEHLEYLRAIVKLKLWFLWHWLEEHPEEGFVAALRRRVDIFRKTIHCQSPYPTSAEEFAVPAWNALEEETQELYEAAQVTGGVERFEEEGLLILWDAIEAANLPGSEIFRLSGGHQCDSLKYDAPRPEHPQRVAFHIYNSLRPRSIFDDREYLPRCFFCLMDKSAAEHGADALCTGTWLNSLPRWLELFPQEYLDNMQPEVTDITFGLGIWGQFVNARGTFNQKYGQFLRETGRFPLYSRFSWCSFAAMRRHLEAYSMHT